MTIIQIIALIPTFAALFFVIKGWRILSLIACFVCCCLYAITGIEFATEHNKLLCILNMMTCTIWCINFFTTLDSEDETAW